MAEKTLPISYVPWVDMAKEIGQAYVHRSDAEIRAVLAGRQCLDGDTVVFRRNGTATRLRNHESAWATGVRPTRRYRFRGGAEVVCTDNHPVLTPSGFRSAGDLRVGDEVVALSEWSRFGATTPRHGEAHLLGYFSTDGSGGRKPGQSPKFTNIRAAYLDEFEALATDLFAIAPIRYPKGKGADLLLTTRARRPNRNPFTAWIRQIDWDHGFPLDVFSWSRSAVADFVNRAWSGDGTVRVNGRKPDIFFACGNDEVYARYWQALLYKFGIWSAIKREQMPKGTGTFHRLVVGCGAENVARFLVAVGPVFGKEVGHRAVLDLLSSRRSNAWPRNPSWWRRTAHGVGDDGEALAITQLIAIEDSGQREVFDVAYPGKGWFIAQGAVVHNSGKSLTGVSEIATWAMSEPDQILWWVTASLKTKDKAWRDLNDFIPKELVTKTNLVDLYIRLKNGSTIWIKSAEAPDSFISETLNGVVGDEFGQWKSDIWFRGLMPMFNTTKMRALFIGTPRGKNWAWELWRYGRDAKGDALMAPKIRAETLTLPDGTKREVQMSYESFHWTSYDSPYAKLAVLEEARRSVSRDLFAQEWLAEAIDNAAGVFRNVRTAIKNAFVEPDRMNWLGIDLARKHDFSAFVVMNAKREIVHVERSQADWAVQKSRIAALAFRYNANIVIDATGLGDPVAQDLRDSGFRVEDVVLSNASKSNIVDALRLAFEQGAITIPDNTDLISELEAYQYEVLAGGKLRYSAPEGQHDDLVIATALAHWGARSVPMTYSMSNVRRSYMPRNPGSVSI